MTLLFHISLLGMEEIQKRFEEAANKVDPKSVKDAIHYKSQLENAMRLLRFSMRLITNTGLHRHKTPNFI